VARICHDLVKILSKSVESRVLLISEAYHCGVEQLGTDRVPEIKIVKRSGLALARIPLEALRAKAVGYAIPPDQETPQQKVDPGLTSP
jgi:hypothetical protein